MTFEEIGLNDSLLEAISYMGFEKASPIQEQAIPEILKKNDLIACAQTGTGKTAAFTLPVLHHLSGNDKKGVKALIVAPTRELAIQIEQQIQGFSYFVSISSMPVYGGGDGGDWDRERAALTDGNTEVIVGTPGKLISHIKMGYVDFSTVEYLILDEADKMLDMGFYEDIQKIISTLPKERQTLMFSATMAPKIRQLAKQALKDNAAQITIELSKPAEGVLQGAFLVYEEQKVGIIDSLIKGKDEYDRILVFTSTKSKVNDIARALKRNGYKAEGISSDLDQSERIEVLSRFRTKETRVLVATDVLSRGIDIKEINVVFNYDVPGDAEDYVHRVGRTARANTTGVAITLVNERDMPKFKRIEELIENEVFKMPVPPELGEGPEWKVRAERGKGKGKGKRKYGSKPKGKKNSKGKKSGAKGK